VKTQKSQTRMLPWPCKHYSKSTPRMPTAGGTKTQNYPRHSGPKRCSCGQRIGPMTFARKPGFRGEVVWYYIRSSRSVSPSTSSPCRCIVRICRLRLPRTSAGGREYRAGKKDHCVRLALSLVGDVHQPLHTLQLVTREYPHGDRGGNEIYLQTAPVAPHWTCTAFGPENVRFGSDARCGIKLK
jgi:hypothetical protein